MYISSAFDGGSIEVVESQSAPDILVRLRNDTNCDFKQWFYFRLSEARGRDCRIQFLNASEATYPDGFRDYRAMASYDQENWFRLNTTFDGKVLAVHIKPEYDSVFIAYFTPYSLERHQKLIGMLQKDERVRHEVLGQTPQGRDLDLLIVGDPDRAALKIWMIARQHPGETMAEWFMEGFLHRLLDANDPLSRSLLQTAVLYLVPNMNPDGSFLGNLRANQLGKNLNREWAEPSIECSPEVYFTRQKILSTGADLFLDVHGDEALPYSFFAGCEGIPSYSQKMAELEDEFTYLYEKSTPDFQSREGYPKSAPNQANMTMATTWVGEHLRCLSLTLEMPFKDNANLPDSRTGFSAQRAKLLGRAIMHPMVGILGKLR